MGSPIRLSACLETAVLRSSTAACRRLPILASLTVASILIAWLGTAVGRQPAVGPHDTPNRELDVAEYWVPRHRVELRRRGLAPNDVAHVAARGKPFSNPKRVSDDLLGPPPASLPTAQAETQTEPYLAINPEDPDNLVAAWQETRFTDGGARALGFATSTDGGRRWTEGRIPGLTTIDGGPWDRASDPWPAFGPNGVAYYSSLLVTNAAVGGPNAIAVSRSDDGGLTWGAPVEVTRSTADFNDKNSMTVDTAAGSKKRGNVYVGWDANVAGGGGFVSQKMLVSRSRTGATSFERPRRLRNSFTNIGIIIRVGPNGMVYAIWSSAQSNTDPNLSIVLSKSTNGGKKWTRPKKVADLLATGMAGYRSGTILPSFDVDPDAGTLYVAWADSRFTGVDQAALAVSTDRGKTWSTPARVNDTPGDSPIFTVSVAANADGEVAVGYYSIYRNPSVTTQVDYVVNVSADRGASFGPGLRVTRKSFPAVAAAYTAARGNRFIFLGDYVGLAGAGDSFFALFTATYKKSLLKNGRQPDIFAARRR